MGRTLSEKYSIKDHVEFRENAAGFSLARLSHGSGAQCELSLYGAHVQSWITPECGEILFMSRSAIFETGVPIRGGIPVIFPQFGPGPLPRHGFARQSFWDIIGSGISDRDEVFVKLRLSPRPEIYDLWPHQFTLDCTVSLGTSLTASIRVTNTGDNPFSFTAALHTYFAIGAIGECSVEGLHGCEYLDMLRESKRCIEDSRQLRFSEMIDRRYLNTPRELLLSDSRKHRRIEIKKVGFKDAVVWNPWRNGARGMIDLGTDDYSSMLCVEAAYCDPALTLAPGEFWIGAQLLHCLPE